MGLYINEITNFNIYSLKELFCILLLRIAVSFSGIRNAIPVISFIMMISLISALCLKLLNDDAFHFILGCGNLLFRKLNVPLWTCCIFIFVTDLKKSSQQCAVAATFPSCRRAQYPAVRTKLGSCPKPNHLFTCCPQRRACEERAVGWCLSGHSPLQWAHNWHGCALGWDSNGHYAR